MTNKPGGSDKTPTSPSGSPEDPSGPRGDGRDTCPVASGAFAQAFPSSTAPYRHVALGVATDGAVALYTTMSSDHEPKLYRLTRTNAEWSSQAIATSVYSVTVASGLATSGGDDPCVAYTDDDTNRLHLACASIPDRIIAAKARDRLAIAEVSSGPKQVIYTDLDGSLRWVSAIDTPAPETITRWTAHAPSMVVDAAGVPHVAFVGGTSTTTIQYATRTGTSWTVEDVDTDTDGPLTYLGLSLVSLQLVAGKPVIAYHHHATRSLKLAVRTGSTFTRSTLEAPSSDFADDMIGRGVELQADCMGRLHIVYYRDVATDPHPNMGLFYGRIVDGKLVDREALPSTSYAASGGDLSVAFRIGRDGRQHLAAELTSLYGGIYYGVR